MFKPLSLAGALLTSFLGMSTQSLAAGPGDLLVSPVRVVFEGRARVAEVTLVNKSDAASTYRVSVENRRMRRDGSFEVVEESDEKLYTAEKLFRYAPRRIHLEPNAPQTLRIMLRKPSDLVSGEYRSHLQFAAIPADAGSNSIEEPGAGDGIISIRLTPIYGVTIPVIVRHGDVQASASIANPRIISRGDGRLTVAFIWRRSGNMSLYGDFKLYVDGKRDPIAIRRGLALYTPNQEREIEIELPPGIAQEIDGKSLEIHFEDLTQSGDGIAVNATIAAR